MSHGRTHPPSGSRWTVALWGLVAGAIVGCDPGWAPALSGPDRTSLEAWLTCDECTSGERAIAAGIGGFAVAPLDEVLTTVPEEWTRNLRISYGRAAARSGLSGPDSTAYVVRYLGNFSATVQRRSALALGDIGIPSAIQSLEDALAAAATRGYRPDVVRVIRNARNAAVGVAFVGTMDPVSAAFLDTIWVTQPGNVAWDGDESVILRDVPFPSDVFVGFRGTDSLGFVAGGPVGRYVVSLTNVGATQVTQTAEVRIKSFPAPPTLDVADVTGGPFPMTMLRSLSRATAPQDTAHLFRFHPAVPLDVTATVEWTGSSTIDIVWTACRARSVPDRSPGALTGWVVDELGMPVASVQLRAIGTALSTFTDPQGRFALPGLPAAWTGLLRSIRLGYQTGDRPSRVGEGEIWIVTRSSGSGPNPPFSTTVTQGASPNSASLTIPAGQCRILGILKSDTSVNSTIVKLHVTSP